MGRASTKENKNIYQRRREELGLTREAASERLHGLSQEKIERIENERTVPQPDEVLIMSEGYKDPQLCNYYCANECPIGKQYDYMYHCSKQSLKTITTELNSAPGSPLPDD